ncbi:hypothetical protein H5U35_00435 [Candidatus Aerophobetes bacterium]|nr:hypothetical protein [Candidatus Aerophobetes bacterium]
MLFWRKRKKEELTDEQVEQVVLEYADFLKQITGKYLPRRMRRALNRNKGWGSLNASQKRAQIQEIKQKGLGSWLEESTQQALEEVASFVSDSSAFEKELREGLKELKRRWNIK